MTGLVFSSVAAAVPDTRCYEMRTYYAAPGKLDALHSRFRDYTMRFFERHGITNIGYWVPAGTNSENMLVYILAYPNREARDKSWGAFMKDPEWQAAYKASEAKGPLVTRVVSRFMHATDYSPAIHPGKGKGPRVFELRAYTAVPGKLDALNARFRDHTIALFSKHGMTHIGYWNLDKDQKGSDVTLIYMLAHQSHEAAAKSFQAFRTDPAWIKAKEASEAGSSLTIPQPDGVKSEFLKATDYSPLQ